MADSPVIDRVRVLITPIVSDLHVDLYDLEMRGNTLRVVLDTPPGSESGISIDTITLATRLISTEFDHSDPIPGSYILEVTSPGLERQLRTAAHFQREIGKVITLRLANTTAERRLVGTLVAATDSTATLSVTSIDGAELDEPVERVIELDNVDKARTVFEWGAQPKKTAGKAGGKKTAGKTKSKRNAKSQRSALASDDAEATR